MGQSNLIIKPKSANTKSPIESLPHELLTLIIMKVAASSFTDVFNVKLASKFLNKAAEDNHVFKKISVKNFPMRNWEMNIAKEAASKTFLERCMKNGNPEALYKQGVIDYFGRKRKEESGFKFLDQAAELGYHGARYIMAIILILSKNDAQTEQGVKMIRDIKRSHATLKECREKFEHTIRRMWVTDQIHGQRLTICTMKNKHEKVKGFGWKRDENDINCDACQVEEELDYFCGFFRPVDV